MSHAGADVSHGFSFDDTVSLLARTPMVLTGLLDGLPHGWLSSDEGPGTWTAVDVVRHLVHGEVEDWIPRVRHALAHRDREPWPAFDPERLHEVAGDATLHDLLDRFTELRADGLQELRTLITDEAVLDTPALHPSFGRVTLRQHLATWAAHDLNHLRQATRAMALRHREAVGPWSAFLGILAD